MQDNHQGFLLLGTKAYQEGTPQKGFRDRQAFVMGILQEILFHMVTTFFFFCKVMCAHTQEGIQVFSTMHDAYPVFTEPQFDT